MARAQTNSSKNDTTPADLTDQIETLRNDLSMLTETIADMGKAKGEALSDAAARKAARAQEKGADAVEYATERAQAAQSQANAFVHNQPAAALGIAAGLGFLIGMISTRR
ncbi:DUF883 family protein [Roseovarius sp. LXJ103]|uniref:DUF883 family protein n=1 Tax=Roseovarius carneus TaxID=2853164 RepID=UPI000D60A324|nr:DUF883 family protein [Roseovarius carneus]MBZ8118931.1 DUF883 family protein [Roseovarius carneus]PWE35414.1 DUF883 domain-containing protein [Pelagicola sp. LXJ1103]